MKDYFEFKKNIDLQEKFRLPKPPFKYMHIVGFEGAFKVNVQSMHDDNVSPAVIKDVKAGLKIVEKHLKKQGMRYREEEVLIGPMDVAKKEKLKPGEGATDFAIDIFPGFSGKNPDLPSGKTEDDINLDEMVAELGKLKSFANFPRTDFSANYGGKDPSR
jgi:hypothetical protein